MGIMKYNEFAREASGGKTEFTREELFGTRTLNVAVDGNLVYYQKVGPYISQQYISHFDFILRNLRIAYFDGRFRVYHERIEYDDMERYGLFINPDVKDDKLVEHMKKRKEYFLKTRSMTIDAIDIDNQSAEYKSDTSIYRVSFKNTLCTNQIFHYKKACTFSLKDMVNTGTTNVHTDAGNMVNVVMQENVRNGLLNIYRKLGIDIDRCSMLGSYNTDSSHKNIEVCCDDILNDVPLFTSERDILLKSVEEFIRYANKLEAMNVRPLFVFDQSVFGTSPYAGNCTENFTEGSQKLRNINKTKRYHNEPSRYIMFLTAVELLRRGYAVTVGVGEGELYCAHLQKLGIVDCIDTNDTDALAAGATLFNVDKNVFRNTYMSLSQNYNIFTIKLILRILVPYCNGYDFDVAHLKGCSTAWLLNQLETVEKLKDTIQTMAECVDDWDTPEGLTQCFMAYANLDARLKGDNVDSVRIQKLANFYYLVCQQRVKELPPVIAIVPSISINANYRTNEYYYFKFLELLLDDKENRMYNINNSLSFAVWHNIEKQVDFSKFPITFTKVDNRTPKYISAMITNMPLFTYRIVEPGKPMITLTKSPPGRYFMPYLYKAFLASNAKYIGKVNIRELIQRTYAKYFSTGPAPLDESFFTNDASIDDFVEIIGKVLGAKKPNVKELMNYTPDYPQKLGVTWDLTNITSDEYYPHIQTNHFYENTTEKLPTIGKVAEYSFPVDVLMLRSVIERAGALSNFEDAAGKRFEHR